MEEGNTSSVPQNLNNSSRSMTREEIKSSLRQARGRLEDKQEEVANLIALYEQKLNNLEVEGLCKKNEIETMMEEVYRDLQKRQTHLELQVDSVVEEAKVYVNERIQQLQADMAHLVQYGDGFGDFFKRTIQTDQAVPEEEISNFLMSVDQANSSVYEAEPILDTVTPFSLQLPKLNVGQLVNSISLSGGSHPSGPHPLPSFRSHLAGRGKNFPYPSSAAAFNPTRSSYNSLPPSSAKHTPPFSSSFPSTARGSRDRGSIPLGTYPGASHYGDPRSQTRALPRKQSAELRSSRQRQLTFTDLGNQRSFRSAPAYSTRSREVDPPVDTNSSYKAEVGTDLALGQEDPNSFLDASSTPATVVVGPGTTGTKTKSLTVSAGDMVAEISRNPKSGQFDICLSPIKKQRGSRRQLATVANRVPVKDEKRIVGDEGQRGKPRPMERGRVDVVREKERAREYSVRERERGREYSVRERERGREGSLRDRERGREGNVTESDRSRERAYREREGARKGTIEESDRSTERHSIERARMREGNKNESDRSTEHRSTERERAREGNKREGDRSTEHHSIERERAREGNKGESDRSTERHSTERERAREGNATERDRSRERSIREKDERARREREDDSDRKKPFPGIRRKIRALCRCDSAPSAPPSSLDEATAHRRSDSLEFNPSTRRLRYPCHVSERGPCPPSLKRQASDSSQHTQKSSPDSPAHSPPREHDHHEPSQGKAAVCPATHPEQIRRWRSTAELVSPRADRDSTTEECRHRRHCSGGGREHRCPQGHSPGNSPHGAQWDPSSSGGSLHRCCAERSHRSAHRSHSSQIPHGHCPSGEGQGHRGHCGRGHCGRDQGCLRHGGHGASCRKARSSRSPHRVTFCDCHEGSGSSGKTPCSPRSQEGQPPEAGKFEKERAKTTSGQFGDARDRISPPPYSGQGETQPSPPRCRITVNNSASQSETDRNWNSRSRSSSDSSIDTTTYPGSETGAPASTEKFEFSMVNPSKTVFARSKGRSLQIQSARKKAKSSKDVSRKLSRATRREKDRSSTELLTRCARGGVVADPLQEGACPGTPRAEVSAQCERHPPRQGPQEEWVGRRRVSRCKPCSALPRVPSHVVPRRQDVPCSPRKDQSVSLPIAIVTASDIAAAHCSASSPGRSPSQPGVVTADQWSASSPHTSPRRPQPPNPCPSRQRAAPQCSVSKPEIKITLCKVLHLDRSLVLDVTWTACPGAVHFQIMTQGPEPRRPSTPHGAGQGQGEGEGEGEVGGVEEEKGEDEGKRGVRDTCVTVRGAGGTRARLLHLEFGLHYLVSVSARTLSGGLLASSQTVHVQTPAQVHFEYVQFDPKGVHDDVAVDSSMRRIVHRRCPLGLSGDEWGLKPLLNLPGSIACYTFSPGYRGMERVFWECEIFLKVLTDHQGSLHVCSVGICQENAPDSGDTLADNPTSLCCLLAQNGSNMVIQFWDGWRSSISFSRERIVVMVVKPDKEKLVKLGFFLSLPRKALVVVDAERGRVLHVFPLPDDCIEWIPAASVHSPRKVACTVTWIRPERLPDCLMPFLLDVQSRHGLPFGRPDQD